MILNPIIIVINSNSVVKFEFLCLILLIVTTANLCDRIARFDNMSESQLTMLLDAGIGAMGFRVAKCPRKKRVKMNKITYKSHYVGRLVRKRFHMSDGTTKWFTPWTLVENSINAIFNQNTLSLKVHVSFKPPREHNGISFMKVTHIQDSRGRLPLIII